MPSKLKKAIGAVKDQTSISIAKVASNSSSNLDIAVLKTTTHDDDPIEERHVKEVLDFVSANKAYAAACARAIGKRIGRTRNWIVALKSLMLVLRIFQDGDPYFPREVLHAMKRGAKILNLTSFRDDSNSSPWDFTAFVRTFALYLDERLDCFVTGKLQRRYTHREKIASSRQRSRRASDLLRDLKPAMLLDRISYWQRLLERAIATRPTGAAKTNRLVQISLYAVVQETFDLYKDISDGLALLLDSFFHLHYQNCVNAFQTCIRASKQFEELGSFYSLCKSIGVGRTSEYPSVQSISEELMEALQEFLKDQSSFPNDQSGNNLLLHQMSRSNENSARQIEISCRTQSDFSEISESYPERRSEFGSRSDTGSQSMSLEDLISATETRRTPPISIDLEDYSLQYEKKSPIDETFAFSETGSTHSLPVTNSIADFLSLDEWPDLDETQERKKGNREMQEPKHEQQDLNNQETCWELVLQSETVGTSSQSLVPDASNGFGFDAFGQEETTNGQQEASLEDNSKSGWELVLFEATTKPTEQTHSSNATNNFDITSLNSLYNQQSSPTNYYNPFLQDTSILASSSIVGATIPQLHSPVEAQPMFPVDDMFSPAPTFQAVATTPTPTFLANNPNEFPMTTNIPNDPFATSSIAIPGEQIFTTPMSQQNLLQEQQQWLQNQNKIISKHMSM